MTDAEFEDRLNQILDECEWSQERIDRSMRNAQARASFRPVFARFRSYLVSGDEPQKLPADLTEATFRRLYKNTRGNEKHRFTEVLKKLSDDPTLGQKNMSARRSFRAATLVIMADGQWYTKAQIMTSLQKTFPKVDLSTATNVIGHLQGRPPSGKELISKRIGATCQYRLRDAVLAARQAPTKLVTSLVEGVAPIIEELKQWGRHSEYEMSPSAIRILAIRLEKLFEPLKQAIHS